MFSGREQRYIRCLLEISKGISSTETIFKHWGRSDTEKAWITERTNMLKKRQTWLRANIPHNSHYKPLFFGILVQLSKGDLQIGFLESFSAYRFLYERLLGVAVRPVLPSAFTAAAAWPSIEPKRRKDLLQSLPEAAATAPGWQAREPTFIPDYIDK